MSRVLLGRLPGSLRVLQLPPLYGDPEHNPMEDAGNQRRISSSEPASPEGPPLKRKEYDLVETSDTLVSDAGSSDGISDGDDGSLFDFDAGQSRKPLSALCAHCRLICGVSVEQMEAPHRENILALEASAERGCPLCTQFLASVDQEWVDELKKRLQETPDDHFTSIVRREYLLSSTFDEHGVNLGTHRRGWKLDLYMNHLWSFSVDMIPAPGRAPFVPLAEPTMTSWDALPLAKRWVERCRNTHRLCNVPTSHVLPTRLICVRGTTPYLLIKGLNYHEYEEGSVLRSVKSNYTTLSHCWGHLQYLTLTKTTLPDFRQRIPPEALPRTFQDAISITREFGIDYLWIDSLCIIQDDPYDWAREASSMAGVYGNSALNLAASGAPNGSFGCFFERQPIYRYQIETEMNSEVLLWDIVPRLMYERSLARMPLFKRGWALQERILPRRTLHFTSTEIFWECHQKTACETFPEGFPAAISYRRYGCSYLRKGLLTKSMWTSLVELYSECHLSKSSDKLVAISGLARNIQLQTKEQYVAGLWREDLEQQLCWEVSVEHFTTTDPPYRAPSWSWASVDSQIIFPDMESYGQGCSNIRILQVHITPSGPDPLGDVKSGVLRLSCEILLRVTVKILDDGFYIVVNGKEIEAQMGLDRQDINWTSYDHSVEPIARFFEFYALPISGYNSRYGIIGLFLEPTEQNGVFRRAGAFRITGELHPRYFEEYTKDTICHAKKEEYYRIRKDKFGREHRIITII